MADRSFGAGVKRQLNRLRGDFQRINNDINQLKTLCNEAGLKGRQDLYRTYAKQIDALFLQRSRVIARFNKLRSRLYAAKRGRAKHYKRISGEHRIPHKRLKR